MILPSTHFVGPPERLASAFHLFLAKKNTNYPQSDTEKVSFRL
jgi:hypothetical protein